mgnify:CR=1 FL=1|jgi:F0F1-type ATP synthase assembly protein I
MRFGINIGPVFMKVGNDRKKTFVLLSKVVGIGWFVAISITLFSVLGYFLDNKLHTTPFLTLLGVIFGTLVAFVGIIRLMRQIN